VISVTISNVNQQTLIFLGPQGSGKGTQVALLKEFLAKQDNRHIVYFTAGTALRAFTASEGYTQERVHPLIASGKLMPTFITTSLFSARLIGSMTGNDHLILDGFPRTLDQTPDLDTALKFYERKNPTVIYISLSDEAAKERLHKRGRTDDTEEGIEERLRWSHEEAAQVNGWFKKNPDYTFLEINGEQAIEEVHREILEKLKLV